MKYSNELVSALKNKILLSVDEHSQDLVQYSIGNLSLSKNTVIKYVNELIQKNELLRIGMGRYTKYKLPVNSKTFCFKLNEVKNEDSIWIKEVYPFVGKQKPEVEHVLDYAFLEICNNSLEHSQAENLKITVEKSVAKIKIEIDDDGIGIFKKIQQDLNLIAENQSLLELAKGKFTSNPERHSGEGIFFSSKLCNEFYILSDGLVFSPSENIPKEIQDESECKGTKVILIINFDTKIIAKEIFDEYAGTNFDAPEFKTVVPLRIMEQEGMPLTSRSQARRLLTRFEKFTCVVLDFKDVGFVGQGFADEVFRVYANKNTKTKIIVEHANDSIVQMINHVKG